MLWAPLVCPNRHFVGASCLQCSGDGDRILNKSIMLSAARSRPAASLHARLPALVGSPCCRIVPQQHTHFAPSPLIATMSAAPGPDGSATNGSSTPCAAAAPAAGAAAAAQPQQDPVVQYVVLRKDLWGEMKWPLGSVVAQACHASTATMWMFKDDEVTQAYLADANLDHMHKVVLEVKGEAQLKDLSAKLEQAGIKHKLWTEQPENFATCLATKPYPKSVVAPHMKKFQLCKAPLG